MQADRIASNLESIQQRLSQAARRAGRSANAVRLVAVGKTQSADVVRWALEAGVKIIGENYIQESRDKFNTLINMDASWHFIGHLQGNKAKYAVRMFDLIHSVDSEKLAAALDKEAGKIGKVQEILIQVNISAEETKSGISKDQAISLVQSISKLPNLLIKGLMTMPPYFNQPDMARPYFAELRGLKERIQGDPSLRAEVKELSMGMTGDFEVAVEEGATLVRIGTALFGARQ